MVLVVLCFSTLINTYWAFQLALLFLEITPFLQLLYGECDLVPVYQVQE